MKMNAPRKFSWMEGVKVVAHRGASARAYENTLEASAWAWGMGVDGVEADLRMTRDREVVLHHDAELPWWTGVKGKVSERTLEELKKARIGRGRWWRRSRIPRLEEFMEMVPDGGEVWLEIKSEPGGKEPWGKICKRWDGPRVHWISFDPELLSGLRERMPDSRIWWILSSEWQKRVDFPEAAAEWLSRIDPTGLDCGVRAGIPGWLPEMRERGYGLAVWTVDQPTVAEEWVRAGAEMITTNRPERYLV